MSKDHDANFKAKIKSINQYGIVVIEFTHELKHIKNYNKIDNRILKVVVLPGQDSNINDLKFNWTVESFSGKEITLKLDF